MIDIQETKFIDSANGDAEAFLTSIIKRIAEGKMELDTTGDVQ